MNALAEWRSLDRRQRNAFLASFLGWTLDAFDFFLMVFVLRAVAGEFEPDVHKVSVAVTLTLAMRPLGALVFGTLADRFGRRPVLMADILLFSLLELASAFAPSLLVLLMLRAAFGFAMGGEWGIGASLTMETLPARARGLASTRSRRSAWFATLAITASVVVGATSPAAAQSEGPNNPSSVVNDASWVPGEGPVGAAMIGAFLSLQTNDGSATVAI